MVVDINNPEALTSTLDIPEDGILEVNEQRTWTVTLHCGPDDAEIDLKIRVNVQLNRRNDTHLEFRRKKICLKAEKIHHIEEVLVAASGTTTGGQIFYAAIGCACAFIAAILVVIAAYYVRDKKARRHRDPLQ